MTNINRLIGLRIDSIRGDKSSTFILFDDKKTYIKLEEQSCYDYHDCSSSAREMVIIQHSSNWLSIKLDNTRFSDVTELVYE